MKEITVVMPESTLVEIEDWCQKTWGKQGLIWQINKGRKWIRPQILGISPDPDTSSWTWSFTREEDHVLFTLTWCY